MGKDKRYNAVRSMMELHSISTFKEIFDIIPKTLVSKDMGMNYQTFTRKVEDPLQFTIKELKAMADLLESAPVALFTLIMAEIPATGKKKAAK